VPSYVRVKRLVDVLLAGTALIGLSPLLAFAALAVRLDSAGPVIFRQQRVGRHGRLFTMYKFRTMHRGTPEVAKDVLLQGGASGTITRVGRLLRRTSFDELPQLINILRGDMSVVGPRPALYNQHDLIEARRKAGVDRAVPGLTGYAQIMGREDLALADKVAYDAFYVDHISPGLDAKIFLQSFWALISAKGAY
jgi:O-antigen biosynthesis protein WbqP